VRPNAKTMLKTTHLEESNWRKSNRYEWIGLYHRFEKSNFRWNL